MPRSTVLVLAKEPLPGRVKTRLCPPLRPEGAAELAAAAIADTLEAVAASGAERHLLALDGRPGDWVPRSFEVVPQQGATFAERLSAAWSLADGPCVQIGMDTPQLLADDLDRALELVTGPATAALGPADDGGWWALALRRPAPGVFSGVPMSTERTYDEQVASLRRHGLEPLPLATMTDIDTIEDARTVCEGAPRTRTAAALRRLTSGTRVA